MGKYSSPLRTLFGFFVLAVIAGFCGYILVVTIGPISEFVREILSML